MEIPLVQNVTINPLLLAEYQFIIQNEEDQLELSIYCLYRIQIEYDIKIPTSKSKVMIFKESEYARCKINEG